MQLTIKLRLLVGFGILMTLIGLGCGAGYWLAQSAVWQTRTLAETHVAARVAAEEARVSFLQAQKAVSDFLRQGDHAVVDQVDHAISQTKVKLARVQSLTADPVQRQASTQVVSFAEQYRTLFHEVVALYVRRGLTEDQGLQGVFRQAVQEIERKISKQGLAELSVLLLQSRRYEKDYMLRGDERYITQIARRIEEFQAEIERFSLPAALQATLMSLWQNYYQGIHALVEVDRTIAAKTTELAAVAQRVSERTETIGIVAMQDIIVAEQAVLYNLSLAAQVLLFFLGFSLLCGGLAAVRSIRAVSRPLYTILDRVKAIAAGNLTAHIPVTQQDEMGQIATEVNSLATSLRTSLVEVADASETVAVASHQLASTAKRTGWECT